MLGVGVERDAGDIEEGSFLGNVSGVRHNAFCMVDEVTEMQITLKMCIRDRLDSLHTIASALQLIVERASVVSTPDDFLCSPDGMLRLDAICMNLIALGETVKGLDKITHGDFLPHYPEIYWSGVMRMRDKIAHHYFEIDAEVVFNTIEEDIPQMILVILRMIKERE